MFNEVDFIRNLEEIESFAHELSIFCFDFGLNLKEKSATYELVFH